ncbi:macro domain-containing protein [Pseudonocardia tropica]|uniref:Macro domain-containing protein n=1 Tax=Pseudonocardia tropica TaxID=681289 RepID=A0ABV1JVT7_9PSEU
MIEFGHGNLLQDDVEALVNTVNTVGVMGKGVALQFKQAFPANYKAYRAACHRGEVRLGRMFVWDSGQLGPRRYIVNFPTKGHWRSASQLSDVRDGLNDLVRVLGDLEIASIALPALGCGNGGLRWDDVRPLIEDTLGPLDMEVIVHPPADAPPARQMVIATRRPALTFGRAALVAVVAEYARAAMRERFDLVRPGASLLEIQKVMYLLQTAGQPLRLDYRKGRYGPYAENLNPVMQTLEGHYLRGYGDRSRAVLALDPIEVVDGAEDEARNWLREHRPDVNESVDEVLALVRGWESAYGMELLATVLFAAHHDDAVRTDPARATTYVHAWNKRKAATFPDQHVTAAWCHLSATGWLDRHDV